MGHEKGRAEHSFSEIVREKLGGETIVSCYQCGTCASSCPVARVTDRFNPREVIKLSLLDKEEEILSGDSIWLCCSCYNCQERCPQNVEIADVVYALRNLAFKKGHIPNVFREFASAVYKDGRISTISKFLESKREELGLPRLQPTGLEPLRKILSATRFDELPWKEEETA